MGTYTLHGTVILGFLSRVIDWYGIPGSGRISGSGTTRYYGRPSNRRLRYRVHVYTIITSAMLSIVGERERTACAVSERLLWHGGMSS